MAVLYFTLELVCIPKDAWLHFHCRGGRDRTTITMTIIDILQNGKNVSLENIVKRQNLLGGINLFDVKLWVRGTYSEDKLVKRKTFIESVYSYVNDPGGAMVKQVLKNG